MRRLGEKGVAVLDSCRWNFRRIYEKAYTRPNYFLCCRMYSILLYYIVFHSSEYYFVVRLDLRHSIG